VATIGSGGRTTAAGGLASWPRAGGAGISIARPMYLQPSEVRRVCGLRE
jgi:hypothetical protein